MCFNFCYLIGAFWVSGGFGLGVLPIFFFFSLHFEGKVLLCNMFKKKLFPFRLANQILVEMQLRSV